MEKHISFNLILSGETLFVSADFSKIQQVLYNLIDNALKFSHANSAITIETTEKNEKVFVSVKDTGIGNSKDSTKRSGIVSTRQTSPAEKTRRAPDLDFPL